jgi:HSP20 family protein
MALVRWNPNQGLMDRVTDVDRWFNNFFNTDRSYFGESLTMSPLVNVEETDDNYVISAEIPGVKKSDLNISFENNVITISAEKKSEKEKKDDRYHYRERSYGRFYRSIPVPSSVKIDEIEAEYKDGVLNITVPKTEEAKPKSIDVKVK